MIYARKLSQWREKKISLNFFLRRGSFRRKIFNFAEKLGVAFVEYSGYLETRTQHAPHGHLSVLLKTDSNPTSMLRREYQSSCVCVSPGGPPEGILDVAEYIVCRVVFFLFVLVFYPSTIFFSAKLKIFGEKTNVAFFFCCCRRAFNDKCALYTFCILY